MNSKKNKLEKIFKNNKINAMSMVFILVGVICIGIAIYGLYGIYMDYKTADDIYEEAEDEFVQIHIPTGDGTGDSSNVTQTPEGPSGPWYELASVNIEGLQKKYPDVVGWLFFEDGLISYPVMQANDNSTYLYTAYDGTESFAGSIFMEATHSADFTDTHTLIYGHNMKNLSMFGRLKYYQRQSSYYENHAYFQIFHEDEILRYQIFSYQEVGVDSFVYQEYFTSAKELGDRLINSSMVKPGISIEDDDKIITLSTCTADDAYRFVVSAVLVERYSLTDKTLIIE